MFCCNIYCVFQNCFILLLHPVVHALKSEQQFEPHSMMRCSAGNSEHSSVFKIRRVFSFLLTLPKALQIWDSAPNLIAYCISICAVVSSISLSFLLWMRRTKESVPPGDEARGGNRFQMKQEVERGRQREGCLRQGNGRTGPDSGQQHTCTQSHASKVRRKLCFQKENVFPSSFFPILYVLPVFPHTLLVSNLIPPWPLSSLYRLATSPLFIHPYIITTSVFGLNFESKSLCSSLMNS